MASTLVALQTVTVGAGGASSISFTSIPQTYNDLVIKVSARTNRATFTADLMRVDFNGSTSSQSSISLQGDGSGASSFSLSTTQVALGTTSATTANTFSNGELYIPNYAGSANKSISADNVGENNATAAPSYLQAGRWSNTDAITSITITNVNSATIQQYSTFTLYGVYNSPLDTAVEAPTIGTATAASTGANVAFTPSGTGAPATSYVATSSPGGITATGYTSPILVTGLTSGTAYTFTVRGQNPGGVGAASAASNSVTPYDGYESIATAYGSGASTVTFSSIPQTYTHLQIRVLARSSASGSDRENISVMMNSDNATNYTSHFLVGNGSTTSSSSLIGVTGSNNQFGGSSVITGSTAPANTFGVSIIDILDYRNTNKNKVTRSLNGQDQNSSSGRLNLVSGLWLSTAAITSLTLTVSAGNFLSNSVFELYGIRG